MNPSVNLRVRLLSMKGSKHIRVFTKRVDNDYLPEYDTVIIMIPEMYMITRNCNVTSGRGHHLR